ncbi:hypothetical protein Tco_0524140 [Tanacetum coccineum]
MVKKVKSDTPDQELIITRILVMSGADTPSLFVLDATTTKTRGQGDCAPLWGQRAEPLSRVSLLETKSDSLNYPIEDFVIPEEYKVEILQSERYSQTSKAYMVLNKETMRIEKYLNVTFDESLLDPKSSPSIEDDRIIEPVVQNPISSSSLEANALEPGYPKSIKEARSHPIEQVIGELNEMTLRSKIKQAYDLRMTFSKIQISRV